MKVFKIIFGFIVLLIIVGLFILGSLVILVDPNKMKPVIIGEVKKQTGYQLAIDGNLSWTFYPNLSVKVNHMTLTAPDESKPFLDLVDTKMTTLLPALLRDTQKLTGDINVGTIALAGMRIEKAHVILQWQNKILTLLPNASFYNGTLTGSLQGLQLNNSPRWHLSLALNKVQLKPLLTDAIGSDSKIKLAGIGTINVQANTAGKKRADIFGHLNGTADFSLTNGVIEGIDLNYLFQTADALIHKQAPTASNSNQTPFENINGKAVILNGVATFDQLVLTSSSFVAKAKGNINLNAQTIDLKLQLTSQQTLKSQWEIPVIISGDLRHPDVRLDLTEIQKLMLKKEIEKVRSKVQEQIKTIPGKATEFLQKLLGQ